MFHDPSALRYRRRPSPDSRSTRSASALMSASRQDAAVMLNRSSPARATGSIRYRRSRFELHGARQHARMVVPGIVADAKRPRRMIKVLQRHGSLADADDSGRPTLVASCTCRAIGKVLVRIPAQTADRERPPHWTPGRGVNSAITGGSSEARRRSWRAPRPQIGNVRSYPVVGHGCVRRPSFSRSKSGQFQSSLDRMRCEEFPVSSVWLSPPR